MRRIGLVVVAVVIAACSAPGVRTDSAVEQTTPEVPTPEPPVPSEPEPEPQPPDTTLTPEGPEEPVEPVEPDRTTAEDEVDQGIESIGDDLFPDLGTDDLDVQSYDVRLAYDPDTQVLEGGVTLQAVVLGSPERIVLDAVEVDVRSVTVDGEAADFVLGGGEVVITPASDAPTDTPVSIDVQYTDQAQRGGSFAGIDELGFFATSGGSYVLNQPDGARTWLPSNDHPADKATWRFEITVPAGTTAVANGALVEQREGPDGDTFVWEQTQPMATYLVQLLTGEYEILERSPVGAVAIIDVALPDDVEQLAPYFDLTDDQLAFFEPLFGPYPLDRYGLAFADSPPGLAMEQQGRSLFSRRDFPGGQPGALEHLLLSHELAHMWFGDAVSPADWSDLWLSESFATYAQWLWLDHVGLLPLEAQAATNLALRQDFPEPTGEPSVDNLFGFERYDGGAVVVHALRQELGDETFFALLQEWVARNNGTSRTTEDFIALADEVAGRDLTAFFDAWLFADDVPDAYPG